MDIATTLFGKYMPPELWASLRDCIPDSLIAPTHELTTEQQFFAGGHLMGFDLLKDSDICSVEPTWTTGDGTGTITRP
jgi:hypothetical protein